MRGLLQKDRRGVSVVIGYVLLIAMALGISGAVYAFLKFYVPKDVPQCPLDVNIIVTNMSCSAEHFEITLSNKGLFSVDGVYIKLGVPGETYRSTINCPTSTSASTCKIYFAQYNSIEYSRGLKPDQTWSADYSYEPFGDVEVEVTPLMFVGGSNYTQAICTNAIIRTTVKCI